MDQDEYERRVMALVPPNVLEAFRPPRPAAAGEELAKLEQEIAYLDAAHADRVRQEYARSGLKSAQKLMQRYKAALLDLEIAYKEKHMPPTQSPSVAREGDILDIAIDAADLRMSEADQVYDRWKSKGLTSALALVATFKAAPGMQTIEVPAELAGEIAACRAQWGDTPFAKMLRQARGGQVTTSAKLSDGEKPAATLKALATNAELAKTAQFKDDSGRSLFRLHYDELGRPLE